MVPQKATHAAQASCQIAAGCLIQHARQQGNEYHRSQGLVLKRAIHAPVQLQELLLAAPADRGNENAARGELFQQCRRQRRRPGSDHDAIERRMFAPADMAVIVFATDPGEVQRAEAFARHPPRFRLPERRARPGRRRRRRRHDHREYTAPRSAQPAPSRGSAGLGAGAGAYAIGAECVIARMCPDASSWYTLHDPLRSVNSP